MAIPPRKYFSEVTLGLNTKNAMAIPPDQLSKKSIPADIQDVIDSCHIYLICSRARLSFNPEKFEYDGSYAVGNFVRRIDGISQEHGFKFRLINRDGGKVAVSPYPHREILGYDKNDSPQNHWPASLIVNRSDIEDRSITDYEVLYVGQAFGDGTRTAFDRLKSHDTLQKILAETHETRPDDEIMLFLFEYEPAKAFVSMDGITNDAEIKGDADTEHLRNVLYNPISDREEIGIAEAG